jgi:hypothetical protein
MRTHDSDDSTHFDIEAGGGAEQAAGSLRFMTAVADERRAKSL